MVAPSFVPRRSGNRIKTDKLDAPILVRLVRGGELTNNYVPTSEDKNMVDLFRCRVDIRQIERKTRQQLLPFLLRNGLHWPVYKKLNQWQMDWLADLDHRAQ